MAEGEINKQINFKAKMTGLDVVQKGLETVNDNIVSIGLSAATSENKVQGLASALKDMVAEKIIGQLGALTGFFVGITTALYTLARNSDAARKAMAAVADLEFAEVQFKPLLKGAQAAKDRIAELFMFAAKTPFKFGEVANASKVLEVLTRGALSTGKALEMIGDAAAVSGAGFEETSMWVGRLYDGLKSGRPVGEALARLQEMGLVSGMARNRIEQLAEAGSDLSAVWPEVEKELGRAKGGMKDMSDTLQGLQSTLEDTKTQFSAKFGAPFLEAEKAGVKAAIKAFEDAMPFVEAFSRGVSAISTPVEKFVYGLAGMSSWLKTLAPLAEAAFPAAVTASIVSLGSAIWTATANIGYLNGAFRTYSTTSQAAATATAALNTVQAANGVIAKSTAASQAFLNIVMGEGTLASRASAAAMFIYRGTLMAVSAAARAAGAALLAMAFNPFVILTTAFVTLMASIVGVANSIADLKQALTDIGNAGIEAAKAWNAQAAAIQTLDDKLALVKKSYDDVAKARADLEKQKASPETWGDWMAGGKEKRVALSADNLSYAEQRLNKAKGVDESNLGMNAQQMDRARAKRDAAEQAKQIVWDARSSAGNLEEQQIVNAEKRLDLEQKIASAKKEEAGRRATDAGQNELNIKIAGVQERIKKGKDEGLYDNNPVILRMQAEVKALEEQKAQLYRESGSDIMRLTQGAEDARKQGNFKKADELTLAAETKKKDFDDQFQKQNELIKLKADSAGLADQAKAKALTMEQLAIENKIAGLKRETYENDRAADALELQSLQKSLDAEKAKADSKRDQVAIAQLENSIKEKNAAIDEKARQRALESKNLQDETTKTLLSQRMTAATLQGDFKAAAAAKQRMNQTDDAQFARNRREELGKTMEGGAADAQVKVELAARQKERAQEAAQFRQQIAAETKVMELRNKGMGREARAIEDASAFRDKVNEGIGAGLSAEEAQTKAKNYMAAQFASQDPTITADSMRAIGFGGEAAGGDDRVAVAAERMAKMQEDGLKYLEIIAKAAEKNSQNNEPGAE